MGRKKGQVQLKFLLLQGGHGEEGQGWGEVLGLSSEQPPRLGAGESEEGVLESGQCGWKKRQVNTTLLKLPRHFSGSYTQT